MTERSSQADPNPDRPVDQSQEESSASRLANDFREALKNHAPEKPYLDDDDVADVGEAHDQKGEGLQAANDPGRAGKETPDLKVGKPDRSEGGNVGRAAKFQPDNSESLPRVDIRESMLRDVFSRRLRGQSLDEIAHYYNRTPRTIRNWLREAQSRQIAKIDKMTPNQVLAKICFTMDEEGARLLRLIDQFLENDQFKEALRAIGMLSRHEERYIRILKCSRFFDGHMWSHIDNALPGSPGRREVADGDLPEVEDDS